MFACLLKARALTVIDDKPACRYAFEQACFLRLSTNHDEYERWRNTSFTSPLPQANSLNNPGNLLHAINRFSAGPNLFGRARCRKTKPRRAKAGRGFLIPMLLLFLRGLSFDTLGDIHLLGNRQQVVDQPVLHQAGRKPQEEHAHDHR